MRLLLSQGSDVVWEGHQATHLAQGRLEEDGQKAKSRKVQEEERCESQRGSKAQVEEPSKPMQHNRVLETGKLGAKSMEGSQQEQVWMSGWGSHLQGAALERAINNVVGGKVRCITPCWKGTSAIVVLPPDVSKKFVLDKDGQTNFFGFKVGIEPGVRVCEVGDK